MDQDHRTTRDNQSESLLPTESNVMFTRTLELNIVTVRISERLEIHDFTVDPGEKFRALKDLRRLICEAEGHAKAFVDALEDLIPLLCKLEKSIVRAFRKNPEDTIKIEIRRREFMKEAWRCKDKVLAQGWNYDKARRWVNEELDKYDTEEESSMTEYNANEVLEA
jgi:hypothetical protein